MANNIKLLGKTIYLRPIQLTDVSKKYVDWLNDPAVNQFLETRYSVQTLESITGFVADRVNNPDELLFAICAKDKDEHIGNIKLGPICRLHKRAQVSLFIGDKDYWNKGIASDAIAAITRYGFEQQALNYIFAGSYASNIGSIKAFERCGYRHHGLLPEYYLVDGKPIDLVYVGITATEFRGDSV